MEKKIILTLNRKGICSTKRKSKNQCKAVGHQDYKYKARIKFHPKLDKQGFVIDHLDVHAAILSVFKGRMTSCEKLAIEIAKAIEKKCVKHGCSLISIHVKIKPVLVDAKDKVMAFMETEILYS